jgi:hypothetical protein
MYTEETLIRYYMIRYSGRMKSTSDDAELNNNYEKE